MRFFYLRDSRRFPVTCVASEIRGDDVVFAISTYNPADPYNRNVARQVAAGRLAANKDVGRIPIFGGKIKERIIGLLVNFPSPTEPFVTYPAEVPERAKQAARLWLESAATENWIKAEREKAEREKDAANKSEEGATEGNFGQQQKQA